MINVIFNDYEYNLLPKKREIYDKYCKILQWGRKYPTRFAETFLNLTFTDSQKYVFLSSWVPKTCVWLMSRSSGKLEVLNSRIYPVKKNGPRTIGALKIGDWIYDENNNPVEVIHLNPIIIEEVYEVIFEDGDVIECGGEHLWQVFDKDNNNWFIYETQHICNKIKQNNTEFYVPLAKFLGDGIKKIISIKRTGKKKPMRCITVDNDTGLYLTGNNYTVTHNSYLSAPFIMVRSLLLPSHNTYIMAPSGSTLGQ